jgi:hypothetical protein
MGPAPKETTMHDTDQHDTEAQPDRGIHWIDRLCAAAWVRTL